MAQRATLSGRARRSWFVMVTACSALALSASCSGFGNFEVEEDVPEQRVAGNPLGGILTGDLFELPLPLDVDLEAETAARDSGPAKHVRLTGLSLAITATEEPAGDTDDFGFIDMVDIFVESSAQGSELPRQRVAHVEGVEPGTRTLSFETFTDVDLLPYVEEGSRLTSESSGTVPPDDVSFNGLIVIEIEVF